MDIGENVRADLEVLREWVPEIKVGSIWAWDAELGAYTDGERVLLLGFVERHAGFLFAEVVSHAS